MESENNSKRKLILDTILPLKLIFWGGLFLLFNIHIFYFDLMHDTIGFVLILVGCLKLAFFPINKTFEYAVWFTVSITFVSLLLYLQTIINPELLQNFKSIILYFEAFQFLAIVSFCLAMEWFGKILKIEAIAHHWRNTNILFAIFVIMPSALNPLILQVNKYNFLKEVFSSDLIALLYLFFAFIPIYHVFSGIKKMVKIADDLTPKDYSFKGAV